VAPRLQALYIWSTGNPTASAACRAVPLNGFDADDHLKRINDALTFSVHDQVTQRIRSHFPSLEIIIRFKISFQYCLCYKPF